MKITSEQVLTICKGDTEIAAHFHALLAVIEKQTAQIQALENRVRDLERQLGQNSQNSSKPPSSDGFRKPTNLRQAGGKKGAPLSHPGKTRLFSPQPDEVILHPLTACPSCSADLDGVAPERIIKRHVLDLPLPKLMTTEHQVEVKCCPFCHSQQQASFPAHVRAPVQYGEGFAAWTVYLNVYQLLPLKRIAQFFEDLTRCRPSQATLMAQVQKAAGAMQSVLTTIRDRLRAKPLVHCDESGLRVQNKRAWLHVVSTEDYTLLGVHPGRQAAEPMGVLPDYKGIAMHDCYVTYFKLGCEHALCNAHLLRECQGIAEHDRHQWPVEMKALLQQSWKQVKAARAENRPLPEEAIQKIEREYDAILTRGRIEWDNDPIPKKTGPRGRKSKSKAANLGQRFELYKESILRFLRDARVPFDNNQAERDLRMCKVKQKISGTFRTDEGSKHFATIRSFISTLLKQNLPLHSSLVSVLRGQFTF